MIKYLLISLLFLTYLSARENPFSPQEQIQEPKFVLPKLEITKPHTAQKTIKQQKEIPIAKSIPIAKTKPIIKKPTYKLIKPTIHKRDKRKKHRIKKHHKKRYGQKLLYNGKFTKIKLLKHSIKIITKDLMINHLKLKNPTRLVIDFERFDVIAPFSKKIYTQNVKKLTIGHHGYFYRLIFELSKNRNYKIKKKPYGYLIIL